LLGLFLEVFLEVFGEVVDGVLVVFVEGSDNTIVDELAVVEVVVDECGVDEEVEDDIEVPALVVRYSAKTSE